MATETLRPTGNGAESFPNQFPDTGDKWDKVDEIGADEDTTYNYGDNREQDQIELRLWFPGGPYTGDLYVLTTSYVTYSQQWALNPDDSAAWEIADINTLDAGARLNLQYNGGYTFPNTAIPETATINFVKLYLRAKKVDAGGETWWGYITQVYVEIDYTPVVGIGAQYIRMNPFGINMIRAGG